MDEKKSTPTGRDRVLWLSRLYKRRVALGLSRKELARLMHLSVGTIKEWDLNCCLPPHKTLARYEAWLYRCERGEVPYRRCSLCTLLQHTNSPELEVMSMAAVQELRERRKELGISASKLGRLMGYTSNSLWAHIERGRARLLRAHYDKAREILYNHS